MLVSAACGRGGGDSAPPAAPVQHGRITSDGQERAYRVYVPPTLDRRQRVPLVLALHGGDSSVDDMVRTSGFDKEALAGEFIVAYPAATLRAWNAGKCCGSAPRRNPDDVGFLTQVLARLEADHPVDRSRVFVTGVSNGAMMAYRFACERADRVTAVGVVAGAVTVDDCQPSRPVSVLEIHGTEDTLIPYLGGQPAAPEAQGAPPYTPTPAMVQRWAEVNGCPPAAPAKASGPVTTEEWTGCHNGSAVSLVTVHGGGHVWFAPGLGPANGAVDATNTIWRFFSGLRPSP
ncbi:MAG: alpha/beta hydrolase-fold protein [Actinomycetota bacterium]|nr:alpha/beta hydrolase-fold protein [Actinomycetota bacterium]